MASTFTLIATDRTQLDSGLFRRWHQDSWRFGISTGNLVFDIGGDGIYPLSHGHIVSSNIVGNVGRGCIALGGAQQVASGNHCFCSSSAAVSAMSALAEAASITGNTILQPAMKVGFRSSTHTGLPLPVTR